MKTNHTPIRTKTKAHAPSIETFNPTQDASLRPSQAYRFRKLIAGVAAIQRELDPQLVVSALERPELALQASRLPDSVLEMLAALADENDGMVAGIALDASAIREAIAYGAASRSFEQALDTLKARARDEALGRRVAVVEPCMAAYLALPGYSRSAAGKHLADRARAMRAAVAGPSRKGRKRKAVAGVASAPAQPAPVPVIPLVPIDKTGLDNPHSSTQPAPSRIRARHPRAFRLLSASSSPRRRGVGSPASGDAAYRQTGDRGGPSARNARSRDAFRSSPRP